MSDLDRISKYCILEGVTVERADGRVWRFRDETTGRLLASWDERSGLLLTDDDEGVATDAWWAVDEAIKRSRKKDGQTSAD